MPYLLTFSIETVEAVSELPGFWSPDKLRALLETLEFDGLEDVTEDQLRDYAVMSLQDLECSEAARVLIELVLGNRLSDGKKQNIAEEMEVERLWEEYPDLSCHEPIFNAQVLLAQAFPSAQSPEVNLVKATLRPGDAASKVALKEALSKGPLPEATIVRCIAAASPENAILNRLFEDQIAGQSFPEAEHLVWHIETDATQTAEVSLSLFSPHRWTDALEEGQTVDCRVPN